jgi:hypothetical protein
MSDASNNTTETEKSGVQYGFYNTDEVKEMLNGLQRMYVVYWVIFALSIICGLWVTALYTHNTIDVTNFIIGLVFSLLFGGAAAHCIFRYPHERVRYEAMLERSKPREKLVYGRFLGDVPAGPKN